MQYVNYYDPTLLRRVQITRETSTNITNITRYFTRLIPPTARKIKKTLVSQNFGETKMLDNKSLIRHFSV